jgi:uncharacterized protein YihD (DUF1040 family)
MNDNDDRIKNAIELISSILKKEADLRFDNNLSITFDYVLPIKKISGVPVCAKLEIARFMKNGNVSLYKIILKIYSEDGFRNDAINLFYEDLFLKDNTDVLLLEDYHIAIENMYSILPRLRFDISLQKFTTELYIPIEKVSVLFSHDNIENV